MKEWYCIIKGRSDYGWTSLIKDKVFAETKEEQNYPGAKRAQFAGQTIQNCAEWGIDAGKGQDHRF